MARLDPDQTGLYQPRAVHRLGLWNVGDLKLKIYGITAHGQELNDKRVAIAQDFVCRDLPQLVVQEGDDNGLGFVIIHAGELGMSVVAHWWIQGSVLCQHIERTLWDEDVPMDTSKRPVIACVWELGLIDAEQKIWRDTMMVSNSDAQVYLETYAPLTEV